MKKKLLIAGSSHTFGLGLELQHSERFNDIEFLKKNGVFLPIELKKGNHLFHFACYFIPLCLLFIMD